MDGRTLVPEIMTGITAFSRGSLPGRLARWSRECCISRVLERYQAQGTFVRDRGGRDQMALQVSGEIVLDRRSFASRADLDRSVADLGRPLVPRQRPPVRLI